MRVRMASVALMAVLAGGCGSGGNHGSGPMEASRLPLSSEAPAFLSVSPRGGATGVETTASLVLRFGVGMQLGMEAYVDLHEGGLDGPTVPLSCAWTRDGTALTCSSLEPLRSRTAYWIHLGGGLVTAGGHRLDLGFYGPMYGGQWLSGPMLGGSHAGHAWGTMAPRWRHGAGSYGMAFGFTTR